VERDATGDTAPSRLRHPARPRSLDVTDVSRGRFLIAGGRGPSTGPARPIPAGSGRAWPVQPLAQKKRRAGRHIQKMLRAARRPAVSSRADPSLVASRAARGTHSRTSAPGSGRHV